MSSDSSDTPTPVAIVFETCVDNDGVFVRAIWCSGTPHADRFVEGPWMRDQDRALQALCRAMEGRLDVWRSLVRTWLNRTTQSIKP